MPDERAREGNATASQQCAPFPRAQARLAASAMLQLAHSGASERALDVAPRQADDERIKRTTGVAGALFCIDKRG